MSIGDIYNIKTEIQNKIGSYIMTELIPLFSENYEMAKELGFIDEENRHEFWNDWTFWTHEIVEIGENGKEFIYKEFNFKDQMNVFQVTMNEVTTAIEYSWESSYVENPKTKPLIIHFNTRTNKEFEFASVCLDDIHVVEHIMFFASFFNEELKKMRV